MLAQWNSAPRTSFGGFYRMGIFLRGVAYFSGVAFNMFRGSQLLAHA